MHRSAARTFDETAQIYEYARPGWPAGAIDWPLSEIGLEPSSALDLGAGTGKLTRLLVERFQHVFALEPLKGMRILLESLVTRAQVVAGTAEDIPLADASIDVVFSADAFHWFDGAKALAEIERVLRPRGALVLMWNEPHRPSEPSISAASALLDERGSSERQVNRYSSGEWRQPFTSSSFGDLKQAQYLHKQVVGRDQLVAYFASMSWIAVLPPNERRDLLSEVEDVLVADRYTRFWRTDVYWAQLLC
jgi:ubiquinone/menaquinone biosynthesis C-methylase UbiE